MEDFFLYKVGPFKAIGFWLSMTTGRLNMGKAAGTVSDQEALTRMKTN